MNQGPEGRLLCTFAVYEQSFFLFSTFYPDNKIESLRNIFEAFFTFIYCK